MNKGDAILWLLMEMKLELKEVKEQGVASTKREFRTLMIFPFKKPGFTVH